MDDFSTAVADAARPHVPYEAIQAEFQKVAQDGKFAVKNAMQNLGLRPEEVDFVIQYGPEGLRAYREME